MLYIMNLTDEYVGIILAKNGQGLITVSDFSQLNEKPWRVSSRYYKGLEGIQGGCPILGLQC